VIQLRGSFRKTFIAVSAIALGVREEQTGAAAKGGIVKRPTVALIAEKGPEVVVPIRKLVATKAGRKLYRVLRARRIPLAETKASPETLRRRQKAATR
jgi:hypothetical protein